MIQIYHSPENKDLVASITFDWNYVHLRQLKLVNDTFTVSNTMKRHIHLLHFDVLH